MTPTQLDTKSYDKHPNKHNNKPNNEKVTKSRRSFVLLLAVFILPVVLAKLALELQWFNYGVTNKGQLYDKPLSMTELGFTQDFKQKWLLLYRMPSTCHQTCLATLQSIQNTYTALGREVPRVTPILLTTEAMADQLAQKLPSAKWQILIDTPESAAKLGSEQVVIVDALGNLVLHHSIPDMAIATGDSSEALEQAHNQVMVEQQRAQKLASFGKLVLADFKKLLKYSRIG